MHRLLAIIVLSVAVCAHAAPHDAVADARSLREHGRYAEARTKLEALAKAPGALEARYQLGLVYRATGDRSAERAIWNGFYDDFDQGRIDKASSKQLLYVARAAQLLGGYKDANDTFRDAVQADSKGKDGAHANIGWARLFLEKYDAGHAEACLDEALAILPDDPDGRTLLARVKLEQSYDVPAALRELDRAEKAAPGWPEAVATRAQIALQAGEREKTRSLAVAMLVRDPEDVSAHTLLAGLAILGDKEGVYEQVRRGILATNPHESRFFHELAELLVRNHRYEEAVPLEEEALKVDPKDAVARAGYGANLLRLGREAEGLTALRESWRGDKYNVRTYNLLSLFEDVIPKHYTFIDAPPFKLRVAIDEKSIIEAEVVPLLQRARKALDIAYDTKLAPVTIELYTDPKHYAVRTIGLPGLDAIGVTFGPVITAMSPSVGKFNWGMVLWHELSHVYAIRASHSRVPRWFTEGLSEYETTVVDPTWTRRTSAELAEALQRGTLLNVGDLDQAFVTARDLAHIVVAYHEASAAVTYFVERTGRPGINAALASFAKGHDFASVVRETTGQDLVAFDAAFRAWLDARLAVYRGQLLIGSSDVSDQQSLRAAFERTHDARTRGLYALALLATGDVAGAAKLVNGETPTSAQSLETRYAAVKIALAQKNPALATTLLAALRTAGGRGVEVELLAARVHKAAGRIDDAWAALVQAGKDDPDRAEPWDLEAELAVMTPKPAACTEAKACAEAALTRAVPLDIMSARTAKALFKLRVGLNLPTAGEAAKRVLEVTPFDGALRLDYAKWLAARNPTAAKRQAELAKKCPAVKDEKARAEE
ncbi:MAG: hypothetical protein ABI321_19315 [Polyangia bacterium]